MPQKSQAEAYEQCWRKDWQEREAHLLPAKNLSAWIQANLYLSLADAPFDREEPTLNPAAGACVTCPRRSGYNTALFADVTSDHCLDGPCYQTKIAAHINRELAGRPELVQIENGWRHAREQRPGAVQRGHFREIEGVAENPDAETVPVCAAAKPAIIVYGKLVGTPLTVCTDNNCPVHDPRAAARLAQDPAPTMAPAPEQETEEEALERKESYEQQQSEYAQMQERRAEERRQEEEQREQEYEAEQARREELRQTRKATFDRILANAPATFSAAQLRMLLRALVNLDPYTFADDVAEEIVGENENNQLTAEEVLLAAIDSLGDEKLTGFALRLALTSHVPIPRDGEGDYLAEAEAVFPQPQPQPQPQPKKTSSKKAGKPTSIKAKKTAAKKKTAA